MSSKNTSSLSGWALIGFLAVAAGYGIWSFPGNTAQAGESRAIEETQPLPETAEADLEARFEQYAAARLEEDWVAVYDLVDPAQREVVDLASFLGVYGQGVLRTHELSCRSIEIDEDTASAEVRAYSVSELVVERLPDQFRAGFQVPDDPEELRRSQEFSMAWVWSAGDWHYQMDNEVVRQHTKPEVR